MNSESRWSALSADERKMIRHDIKGSMTVFQGFHGEVQQALQELLELSSGIDTDPQLDIMRSVLDDDVEPCLEFLDKVALRMSAQLDAFQFLCSSFEK